MFQKEKNIRTPSLIHRITPYGNFRRSKHNSNKKKVMVSRLKRIWYISMWQYEKLFWEKPYLYKGINIFVIDTIWDDDKYTFIDKNILSCEIFLSYHKKISTNRIYRNYTNINNLIDFKNKNNIDVTAIHFDWEIHLGDSGYNSKNRISPDWLIIKDNTVYLIETDMWNISYNAMSKKDYNYYEYIKKQINKQINFKLVLYTTNARIIGYNSENTFKNLKTKWLIDFYPNSRLWYPNSKDI